MIDLINNDIIVALLLISRSILSTTSKKNSIRECAVRESNPGHLVGNEIFYH